MSVEDVVLVATVREEIRDGALRIDVADIPRHLEEAQANRISKVYNAEAEIAKTMRVALPPRPHQRATKEGSTNESDIERSVSVLRVVSMRVMSL